MSKVKHLTRTHEKHRGFMDKELTNEIIYQDTCLENSLKMGHGYDNERMYSG